MIKKDILHEIILSLNSAEKRLFKLYVSKNNSKNDKYYIILFDALSGMEVYSESKLIKKVKNPALIKNLPQYKKYLKDLILKSMRDIDANKTLDEVNNLMKEQEFLRRKNLFPEQWKKLQKAKDVASKFDLFHHQLNILDIEMKYLLGRDFDKSIDFYEEYSAKKKDLLYKINMLSSLVQSKNKIFQILKKYKSRVDADNLNLVAQEISKFDQDEIKNMESFEISKIYATLQANYHRLLGDYSTSLKYRKKIVELYDEKPWFIDMNMYSFLMVNFNYISELFRTKNLKLMKEELDHLKTIKIKNENDKIAFFQNHTIISLLYFLNTNNLDELRTYENEIKNDLKKYASLMEVSSKITIYFNFSLSNFLQDDYLKALNWIDEILNINSAHRKDIQSFVEVLKILCFYNLNEKLIIPSLIKSKRRKADVSSSEVLILKYLLKLCNSVESEHQMILEAFKTELNNEKKNYTGKDVVHLWLEAQLTNQSIKEVYLKTIDN